MGRKTAERTPRPIFLSPARGRRLFAHRRGVQSLRFPIAVLLPGVGVLVLLREPLVAAAAVGVVAALLALGLLLRSRGGHA